MIKPKTLETRNILIDKKSYKDLVFFFTRYHHVKSTSISKVSKNDELIGKTEEYEGTKYMIVDDYTLDKVLDKIKK